MPSPTRNKRRPEPADERDGNHRGLLLVGITGGFGAGKSAVASIIRARHPVLDSDEMARALVENDREVGERLRGVFGTGIFDEHGVLLRKTLASLAFADAKKLAALNAIVHPKVLARMEELAAEYAAKGHRLLFVESALIYEARIEDRFDHVIAVLADTDAVLARADTSRYTESDIRNRIARQLPAEEKAGRADFTIRNNGSIDELTRSAMFILTVLEALARSHVSA